MSIVFFPCCRRCRRRRRRLDEANISSEPLDNIIKSIECSAHIRGRESR